MDEVYRWGRFRHFDVNNRTQTIPPRLLRTLLVRGASLWLLARLMGAVALSAVAASGDGLAILPLWAILMTPGLAFVDFRRRHELMLFRNLGISATQVLGIVTLPAVASEALLVMLVP